MSKRDFNDILTRSFDISDLFPQTIVYVIKDDTKFIRDINGCQIK